MIIERIFKIPHQSFFLFGPRGTGKSTLLKQEFPDALWIDLLEPDTFRTYSAHPENLKEVVLGNREKRTVVVDEIQKIPNLLDVIHSLMEKKLGVRFILTGSSARKLKRTGTDLLAGRAILKTLHPFMAIELGKRFTLNTALKQGLLPLAAFSVNPDETLRTYISLYIREEVLFEGLVRNIGNFSRFLEAVSFSHGSVLNISSVARDCAVERKVVEGYISILEDLLLSFQLPVFTKRSKRAVVSHPKFYYFDAGVFRAIRPSGPLDKPAEIEGMALEGIVAQHLHAWIGYRGGKNRLYYWRTKGGSEVDFILYGDDVFWAIEVKNTSRIRREDLRSLQTFKSDYPGSTAFLLYRGKERLKKNGILCVPCEEFLLHLDPAKTKIF